jgi:hypothetical protein
MSQDFRTPVEAVLESGFIEDRTEIGLQELSNEIEMLARLSFANSGRDDLVVGLRAVLSI